MLIRDVCYFFLLFTSAECVTFCTSSLTVVGVCILSRGSSSSTFSLCEIKNVAVCRHKMAESFQNGWAKLIFVRCNKNHTKYKCLLSSFFLALYACLTHRYHFLYHLLLFLFLFLFLYTSLLDFHTPSPSLKLSSFQNPRIIVHFCNCLVQRQHRNHMEDSKDQSAYGEKNPEKILLFSLAVE